MAFQRIFSFEKRPLGAEVMNRSCQRAFRGDNPPSEFFKILGDAGFNFLDMRKELSNTDQNNMLKNYSETSNATDILCTKNNS